MGLSPCESFEMGYPAAKAHPTICRPFHWQGYYLPENMLFRNAVATIGGVEAS